MVWSVAIYISVFVCEGVWACVLSWLLITFVLECFFLLSSMFGSVLDTHQQEVCYHWHAFWLWCFLWMWQGSSVFLFLWEDIGPFCLRLSFVCVCYLMVMSRWLIGCPEFALGCLHFCSVPDVIAFYFVGPHHWASFVVSCAYVLIPLLWKLDTFASILAVAL